MYALSPKETTSHCNNIGEFVSQYAMELDYLPTITTLAATRSGNFHSSTELVSNMRDRDMMHCDTTDMNYIPRNLSATAEEHVPEMLQLPRVHHSTHMLVGGGTQALQLPQITVLDSIDIQNPSAAPEENSLFDRLPVEQTLPTLDIHHNPSLTQPSKNSNTAGGVKSESSGARKTTRRILGGALTPELIAAHTQAHAMPMVATTTLSLQRALSSGLVGRSHGGGHASTGNIRNTSPRGSRQPVIKKHVCQDCGKGFVSASKLQRHMAVHTGDKPFSCSVCDTRFTQKSALKVHQRRHEQSGSNHGDTKKGSHTGVTHPKKAPPSLGKNAKSRPTPS